MDGCKPWSRAQRSYGETEKEAYRLKARTVRIYGPSSIERKSPENDQAKRRVLQNPGQMSALGARYALDFDFEKRPEALWALRTDDVEDSELIFPGERCGLQTHIAATESASSCVRMKS